MPIIKAVTIAIQFPVLIPNVQAVFHFKGIDKGTVLNYLGKLNMKKGTDNTSSKLLKMTAPAIAESSTNPFNYSLDTGRIHRMESVACVTPVPMKGEKELVEVIDQSQCCQLLQRSLRQWYTHNCIVSYMETNSLLHVAQSGFWPQHSTQDITDQ